MTLPPQRRILAVVLAVVSAIDQSDGAVHNSEYLSKDDIIDFLSEGHILIKDVFPEVKDPKFLEEFEAAKVEASKAYHKHAIEQLECPEEFIDRVDDEDGIPEDALKACIDWKKKREPDYDSQASFYQLIDLHSYSPRIHDVATGERFGAIASDLLQIERVRLYMTSAFRKVPSKNRAEEKVYNNPTYTHTDLIQVPVDTNDYLSFWCPFRDVKKDDSVLSYVDKSHRDLALHKVHHGRYMPYDPRRSRVQKDTKRTSQRRKDGHFKKIDRDGNGRITRAEAEVHFASMGKRMDKKFFDSQDEGGDGIISYAEFMGYTKGEVNEDPRINTFNEIDTDGDEKISYEETVAHFENIKGMEHPEGFFKSEDRNSDGFVSLEEFLYDEEDEDTAGEEEDKDADSGSSDKYEDEDERKQGRINTFNGIDTNRDKKISYEETVVHFRKKGMELPRGFFEGEDANGDGFVSLEEFLDNSQENEEKGAVDEEGDEDANSKNVEKDEDEDETRQDLIDRFNEIDVDGDGQISYEDAIAYFKKMEGVTGSFHYFFDSQDANGDGSVSLVEFLGEAKYESSSLDSREEGDDEDNEKDEKRLNLIDKFNGIDTDGDKKISYEESVAHFREKRGTEIPPGFFEGEDANSDGFVSLEEFLHEVEKPDKDKEELEISDEEKERRDAMRVAREWKMLNDRPNNRLPVHVYDEIGLGDCVVHHGWLDHAATSQGMKGGPREAMQFSYIHGDGKKLEKKDALTVESYVYRYQKWFDDIEIDTPIDHPALPIVWPPKAEGEMASGEQLLDATERE